MSRLEVSHYMSSPEEELAFFQREDILPANWTYPQQVVSKINTTEGVLEGITRVCSMTEAYQLFWQSVKVTSIVCTPSKVCILYATNPETQKHYGVHAAYPYGHTQEELVKRYGVPGRPVKVYMLHQSGAHEKFIYRKSTKVM